MNKTFKVILSGELLPDGNRKQVLVNLATFFHSTPERMEALLHGKPVPLKACYTLKEANKLQKKLTEVGVLCEVVAFTEELASPERDRLKQAEIFLDNTLQSSDTRKQDKEDKNALSHLISQFVAKKMTYYGRQFERFGDPENEKFAPSWNWAAFFVFPFWALYRKQGLLVAIDSLVFLFLIVFIPSLPVLVGWFAIRALGANYWYFKTAKRAAISAKNEPEYAVSILNKGGVSKKSVWLGIGASLFLSMYVMNKVITDFANEHAAELAEVIPGSNTQYLGDGHVFDFFELDQDQLTASWSLSFIAVALKVLMIQNRRSSQDVQAADILEIFIDRIRNSGIKDPWGKQYSILTLSNLIELRSAGPDGNFNTVDDIVQPVSKDN